MRRDVRLMMLGAAWLAALAALPAAEPAGGEASPLLVEGRSGRALRLDGRRYVKGPKLGQLDKATIALWIKTDRLPGAFNSLLSTTGWQRGAIHLLMVGDGRAQLSINDACEQQTDARPGKSPDWQHIAVTHDGPGRTACIYVNGALDKTVALANALAIDLQNFAVAAWNNGDRAYEGALDDVRIYGAALSAQDVAGLAQGRAPAEPPLAWWTFDQLKGNTVVDSSGRKRHGRLMGAAGAAVVGGLRMTAQERQDMGLGSERRGFISGLAADTWEQALISGNGAMGALVMGDPLEETITLNRAGLFLPLHEPLPPVDTASHLKEIRQMMGEGRYQDAADFVVTLSHQEGWGGKRWTDPFIPAFDVRITMNEAGDLRRYARGVDFATGVAAVRWEDDRGMFVRRLFVSRPDNVVVLSLTGPGRGKLDCRLELAQRPGAWGIKQTAADAADGWLTYRSEFKNRWKGSLQGYEGVARVVVKGGTARAEEKRIAVTGADEVLVLTRIAVTRDFAAPGVEGLKQALGGLRADYDALLKRHAEVHGEIFSRVRLDLGGGADHGLPAEELIAKSRVGSLSRALLEKEIDACRYAILSSSGEYPPHLQGIWGGTWTPPWSGDYTQNGNVQSAIASELSVNMPECLQAYFGYLESQLADYRENAKRLYGARGIHVASRTSSHGLNNHFDAVWPMTFWTAGAGWASQFFYDYYLYTGDKEFLAKRALPFMKEAAAFYEDFLFEGQDGRYVFSPSYSPENNPGNSRSQACINATMDIAVARELLTNLIAACTTLGVEADGVRRWKAMLAKMPDYLINKDGAVEEWTTPALEDNYAHRHCSHLYPLFAGLPSDIATNAPLLRAFKVAADRRMEIRRRESGGEMAFGLVQLGLAYSSLRDAASSYDVVDWLANNYWFPNLVTTHNPKGIFNVDLCGGLPAIVARMLVDSRPGLVELLPALPDAWPVGTVEGLRCRGQLVVTRLAWDHGRITVSLKSDIAQTVELRAPAGLASARVTAGNGTLGDVTAGGKGRHVALPAGEPVTLTIDLPAARP